MSERDELVVRLREGTVGSDITKTDVYLNTLCSGAADLIERDKREIERLTAENNRLREALQNIASTGRCEFAAVRAALRSTR